MWLFLGPVIGSIAMQWYIFLTTGTLVRMEGIITELVFEHALRIRMKAQIASDKSVSREASAVNTPDSASIADSDELTEGTTVNGEGSSASGSGDETLRQSSRESSVNGKLDKGIRKSVASSISGKSSRSQKSDPHPVSSSSTDNLVGKLNNLVTTDLANIVEGRDFMLLGQYKSQAILMNIVLNMASSCFCSLDGWHRHLFPLSNSRLEVGNGIFEYVMNC